MKSYKALAIKLGYVPSGVGLKKITENITHWITLFEPGLQMYGYFSGDVDHEKGYEGYDTGIINITPNQLEQLIEIFTTNHN